MHMSWTEIKRYYGFEKPYDLQFFTKPHGVGQISNRKGLESGKYRGVSSFWLRFVKNEDVWARQAEFNEVLKGDAAKEGYSYIDVRVDRFDKSEFADLGHFSAQGTEKFAALISEEVRQACPAS
jgi:hypothetical protein